MIEPKIFKQVRKALGLSQQELADALGLSRVTVNKMENGKLRRGIPDEIAARLMYLKPAVKSSPVLPVSALDDDKPFSALDDNYLWDNEEDES